MLRSPIISIGDESHILIIIDSIPLRGVSGLLDLFALYVDIEFSEYVLVTGRPRLRVDLAFIDYVRILRVKGLLSIVSFVV